MIRAMLRTNRGSMLLEVLAGMTIFAIALGGLAPLMIGGIRGVHAANKTTAATALARAKLEDIYNTPFANVTAGNDSLADPRDGTTYARTWTLAAGPTAGTQVVTVTVAWTEQAARNVTLGTIIHD